MKYVPWPKGADLSQLEQIYAIFPEAQIGYDNYEQLIIYTGYYDNPEEEKDN